jgi:hypothetical protein
MQHDTFNADFYITAATVIPLLYLALTLQGNSYDSMMRRARELQAGHRDPRRVGEYPRLEHRCVGVLRAFFHLVPGQSGLRDGAESLRAVALGLRPALITVGQAALNPLSLSFAGVAPCAPLTTCLVPITGPSIYFHVS